MKNSSDKTNGNKNKKFVSSDSSSRNTGKFSVGILILILIICIVAVLYFTFLKPEKTERNVSPLHPSPPEGMVYVPGGEFTLGGDEKYDSPSRKVKLEAFFIDKYPVTQKEFFECPDTDDIKKDRIIRSEEENYPVTEISYEEADMYSRWKGKRLPTEDEWEAAARGKEGLIYPWGNSWDTSKIDPCEESPFNVGKYPSGASPWGVEDMVGNIFHFTCTSCSLEKTIGVPERQPPLIIVKAGAWTCFPSYNRCAFRVVYNNKCRSYSVGFRCVKPVDPQNDYNFKPGGILSEPVTDNQYDSTESMRQLLAYGMHPGWRFTGALEKVVKMIKKGDSVADIGCGLGFLSFLLAERTGSEGKVYAVDIDTSVLEFLKVVAEKRGVKNIIAVKNIPDNILLPEKSCNQIWLLGTFRYVKGEERINFFESCYKALKEDGLIILIGTKALMSEKELMKVMENIGFVRTGIVSDKDSFEAVVVYKKPGK